MTNQTKTCKKCKAYLPATLEFFYKNAGGKYGLTPRCKPCVNQDNLASHAKRLAQDPEKVRAQATTRAKRSYYKNLEANQARQRNHQAKRRANPDTYLLIQSRKRADGAGLTPDQLEAMFQAQGCVCAICGANEPGSKIGWNVDHCHKTDRVRFVLCAHCNRGLGAFRDNPALMRKAADMLETITTSRIDPTSP